jgi:hypothetical protein
MLLKETANFNWFILMLGMNVWLRWPSTEWINDFPRLWFIFTSTTICYFNKFCTTCFFSKSFICGFLQLSIAWAYDRKKSVLLCVTPTINIEFLLRIVSIEQKQDKFQTKKNRSDWCRLACWVSTIVLFD